MKSDRIIEEHLWASVGEDWSAGMPDQTLTKRGTSSLRWDTPETIEVANPSIAGDWSGYNRLDFHVHASGPAEGYLMVEIWCASRTGSLPTNDYYFCGVKLDWQGWKHVVMPFQNFLIYGIPDGWRKIEKVVLRRRPASGGPAVFHVDDLHLANVEFPQGPRLTDEEFFTEELDLDFPGLERVRAAAGRKDWSAAANALFEHVRTRTRPNHIFARTEVPQDFDAAEADRICRHRINGQQLGPRLDWQANPIGYLEWMHAFNRHRHWVPLATAYRATNDEKYAREWNDQLKSWIEDSPVPADNDGGWGAQWKMICVGCRTMEPWFETFFSFLSSPSFETETFVMFLKSLVEHARQVVQYNDVTTTANMRVMQGRGLVNISVCLPELKRSAEWRALAYERLTDEITRRQVYPDGAQKEHSPSYHETCARLFSGAYELALVNGLPVPDAFRRQLEKMYEYALHLSRPDGTRFAPNDSGGVNGDNRPFLKEGDRLFNRPDLRFVATGGKEGHAPAQTSAHFPYVGYAVTRSGWDRDARTLFFDGGPIGETHQHEDKLNIEVCAYGTLFLVDPGIASYLLDEWTAYYRGADSHNIIRVDGRPQNRRALPPAEYTASGPQENGWASCPAFDFVRGVYADGFGDPPDRSVTHERKILFVKDPGDGGGGYWLIGDRLTGEGAHTYDALYHFMPMRVILDPVTKAARTRRLGRPNLDLVPLHPEKLSAQIVTGGLDPVQGWVAEGGRERDSIPAPTAIYTRHGRLPVTLDWALLPYPDGDAPKLTVEALPVHRRTRDARSTDAAGLRATSPDGRTDHVLIAHEPGVKQFGPYEFDGDLALITTDAAGRITRLGLIGGTCLRRDGERIVTSEHPIQHLSLLRRGDFVEIRKDGDAVTVTV